MHHRNALSHIAKKHGHHKKHHTHGAQSGHGNHGHGHGGHGGHVGHGAHSAHGDDILNKSDQRKLRAHPLASAYAESDQAPQRGCDVFQNTALRGLQVDQHRVQTDNTLKAGVDLGRCVGCGKCHQVCPSAAIDFDGAAIAIDTQRCIGCGQCVARCKKGALFLMDSQDVINMRQN